MVQYSFRPTWSSPSSVIMTDRWLFLSHYCLLCYSLCYHYPTYWIIVVHPSYYERNPDLNKALCLSCHNCLPPLAYLIIRNDLFLDSYSFLSLLVLIYPLSLLHRNPLFFFVDVPPVTLVVIIDWNFLFVNKVH